MAGASRPSRARGRGFLLALGASLALAARGGAQSTPAPWPELQLTAGDRILILAPHPDDEVLGCAGVIQAARALGLPVRIAFLTYGDANEWSFLLYRKHPVIGRNAVRRMGLVRHDEAVAAARALGLPSDALVFLGYPDFRTLDIWYAHWGDRAPLRSILTRARKVPYANALRPGAPYKGEEVLRDLEAVLRDFRPTRVFVSHPADHNPDHRALYLFTRVALWDLAAEMSPEVHPYLVHFEGWPAPRGDHPERPLEPPAVLRSTVAWQVHRLGPAAMEAKRAALAAHRTQIGAGARYLLSFVRAEELYGDFPAIGAGRAEAEATEAAGKEIPEELTEEERAAFVGLARRTVRLEGGELVVSITLSRPLGKSVEVSVSFFGYRADRPFAAMPKLLVRVGALGHAIHDQDRKLPKGSAEVDHRPREITVRVPLAELGNPDRVLTSARTYLGDVPLDWTPWRVVDLSSP